MMKRTMAALLMALAATGLHAQQVQVFSDGKKIATVDEGNGTRLRAHDERESRKPLGERPEGAAIAAAHAAAFVRCGLNEAAYPPEKAITPEQREYFVRNASYIPVKGTSKIILIGEFSRGKAIVDLDKLAVLTPQCPAGVRSLFWSHDTDRIIFATQQVERIEFHGDSRALWTAKFLEPQDVWYSDSAHPAFRKLMSLPKERVLDVMLPDKADHVWVLSQSEKMDLRDPKKWMKAASGAPAKKMTILLRKVNLQGKTLDTITVATGVAMGSAQFVRE
ncbi:MAG: hypothetical protein WKG03_01735 [Telluria sp.]